MITRRMVLRRLVKLALTAGVATALWRTRVLQVAAFLTAGALRRLRPAASGAPAQNAGEWSLVEHGLMSETNLNPRVLVSYHPEYHEYDVARAVAAMAAATQLGVGWIRTDIRWHEVLSDGVHEHRDALAWYRGFLSAASALGLRNMVVLSSPPKAVLRQTEDEKLVSWSRFVRLVVRELGEWCGGYQLMNEPNNPIYSFLSLQDVARAFISGASIIGEANIPRCVAINVSMDLPGWREYLSEVLRLSGSAIQTVGLDYYPGTWSIGSQRERWGEVIALADEIALAGPGSPWSNRRLAIMETGYSTNTRCRGQREQSEYFKHLQAYAAQLKSRSVKDGLVLGIYELSDGATSAWIDPEAHFGLMTSHLEPKSAFRAVTNLVMTL